MKLVQPTPSPCEPFHLLSVPPPSLLFRVMNPFREAAGSSQQESAPRGKDIRSGEGRAELVVLFQAGLSGSACERLSVSSVAQLCLTLCDRTDCSTSGFPVHHQLPEPTQTHVHPVGDAIQPSHPLSSPSPPTFNLSQHQGLSQ